MKPKIDSYELSLAADSDIEEIFEYTEKEFGFEQAVKYVLAFENVFTDLIESPELGRNRDEIKFELRSLVKESHVVFYRILEDRIRIIRVLHESRDIKRLFSP